MAKGYWIGHVEVNNEEGYKPYAAANPAIFKKFGAQVRRPRRQVRVPGRPEPLAQCGDRVCRLCDGGGLLHSPEYQANLKIRQANAITDLIIVEGYDGPQP